MITKYAPVGINTNSSHHDFYVYEWYICETGEIFYVGKGRQDRYKEYHSNNLYAEQIRKTFNTDVKIIKNNLSEEEAIQLETDEIVRIKMQTPYILTNVATPCGIPNAWSKSKTTPKLGFEKTPVLYTTDVEEHYFNMSSKSFSTINLKKLGGLAFYEYDRQVNETINNAIYNGNYQKYYAETLELLKKHNVKIYSSQYAKSVSGWIICGEESLKLHNENQEKAIKRIGHTVEFYHLIDIWKVLKNKYGEIEISHEDIKIKPINKRIPLSQIKILSVPYYNETFDCYRYYQKALDLYQENNFEECIKYLDLAREYGYDSPDIYTTYAQIYRKLKDFDNEIDILNEVINRYTQGDDELMKRHIFHFTERRRRAIDLWKKKNNFE